MSDLLVQWLLRPESYPEPTASVTLVETHISWVFLTDRFAYKLKKPVQFDFLDFSTVELRRAACDAELRLNRRLAPDVYLGLVAVLRDERGEWRLDESPDACGEMPAVNWLLKMQRLPADRTLDALHHSGQLMDNDLTRIAEKLSEFYRNAERAIVSPNDFRGTIARHVRANRSALLAGTADETILPATSVTAIRRLHCVQLQFLVLKQNLFDARIADGRIVDGHGDLRPEHIYLLPEPVVIDCIEFNAEFRRLDVADELSFLATECDFIGADAAGRTITAHCLELLGDAPPQVLLAFYRSYRACVRAKVAALRAGQVSDRERQTALAQAARHLQLADRYTMDLSAAIPPILLVVHGLTGSGKSTLAAALADELGAEWLSTDAIRRQMLGSSREAAGYGKGIYRAADRMAVYESLFGETEQRLADGLSVVLDGTFLTAELRGRAAELARQHGAIALLVHCSCPDEVARQRIAERMHAGGAESESRPEVFDRQKAEEEPTAEPETSIEIKTTEPIERQLRTVLDRLQRAVNDKRPSAT